MTYRILCAGPQRWQLWSDDGYGRNEMVAERLSFEDAVYMLQAFTGAPVQVAIANPSS